MATLAVKVVPGARRDRIVGRLGEAIKLQVSAPPEDGKANAAVIALLAEFLGIDRSRVRVLRGHASPRKIIQIDGFEEAQLAEKFAGFS